MFVRGSGRQSTRRCVSVGHTCGGQPEGSRPEGPDARVEATFPHSLISEEGLQFLHLALIGGHVNGGLRAVLVLEIDYEVGQVAADASATDHTGIRSQR